MPRKSIAQKRKIYEQFEGMTGLFGRIHRVDIEPVERFRSGEFRGKSFEEVFLKRPDRVFWWLLNDNGNSACVQMRDLERVFNRKPILRKCDICGSAAKKVWAQRGETTKIQVLCSDCDVRRESRIEKWGKIHRFRDAIEFVGGTRGLKEQKQKIIMQVAHLKGLPPKPNEIHAIRFFKTSTRS